METNTQAVAAPLEAQPAVIQPAVPTVSAHKTNVLVEVMEGVTLSALLILFTTMFMLSYSFMFNM